MKIGDQVQLATDGDTGPTREVVGIADDAERTVTARLGIATISGPAEYFVPSREPLDGRAKVEGRTVGDVISWGGFTGTIARFTGCVCEPAAVLALDVGGSTAEVTAPLWALGA